MNKASKSFLYQLLETPSPSGYEAPIQEVVRKYVKTCADTIETDLHGNLVAGINTKAKRRVMLAGHCDHIGFMVQHISDRGYLRVHPLGGIDFGVVPGSRATIHTKKGTINAIFGRKPIHLQDRAERGRMQIGEKYNWLDIGAKDGKEAKKLIQIGDPVTYQLDVTELQNNLISAPGLDNRTGCFVAFETLKRCAKKKLSVALYAASTVQEEVGLRGAMTAAYNIDPEVGIAIDVTHANDNPGAEGVKMTDVKLNLGPTISRGLNTNDMVEKYLHKAAKAGKVPVQTDLCPYPASNDAAAIQVSRGGSATATVGIPCRYMHTKAEVVSVDDVENAVNLLVSFITKINSKTSFLPY